jgi:spermidine/putrescine transport system ATP-binding protein
MTMADTIAVMNKGRIEQMGAPVDLYNSPHTAFVANFLGQSNMVQCQVTGTAGERLVADMHGTSVLIALSRAAVREGTIMLGIRPEKLHVLAGEAPGTDLDVVTGGTIIDSSFIGVSTEYIVRMPWGQDLVVFEQNRETSTVHPPGTTVSLAWSPEHAFGLGPEQGADAGVGAVQAPV